MLNDIDSKNIYNFLRLENFTDELIIQHLLEINNLIGNEPYFLNIEHTNLNKLLIISDSNKNSIYSYSK